MYCAACGSPIERDNQYCERCYARQAQAPPAPTRLAHRSGNVVAIVALVLLATIGLSVGAWFAFDGDDESPESSTVAGPDNN
jgi:hypothetical protein